MAEAPDSTTVVMSALDQDMSLLKNLSFNDLVSKLAHVVTDFVISLAIAIFVFYVGRFIIRKIYAITVKVLIRRKVDQSLSTFILSLLNIVLYFILIVTVVGILGVNTSSFIAIFASAGVAIGMALSGTLQNFAGGVLILLLKPYKIGDYIEAQGYAGTVKEIQIFSTIITTSDNKSITIPNGGLSTGSINNWSREPYRRIQWNIGISYGDNVDDARKAILEMLKEDYRIMQGDVEEYLKVIADNTEHSAGESGLVSIKINEHPTIHDLLPKSNYSPSVYLSNLGESSVDLIVRAWVRTDFYWSVFYKFNEMFYNRLPENGVSFPFPQLDVHVKGE